MLAGREYTKKGRGGISYFKMLKHIIEELQIKNHLFRCWRTTHIEEKYQRGKNAIRFCGLSKKVLGREWSSCWESVTFIMKRQFPTVNTVRNRVVPSYSLPSLLIVMSLQPQPLLLLVVSILCSNIALIILPCKYVFTWIFCPLDGELLEAKD